MNEKKRVASVILHYEDGTMMRYDGPALHNCSTNWRQNRGKVYAEWIENVVSWHQVPDEPEHMKKPNAPVVEQAQQLMNAFDAVMLNVDELRKNPKFAGIADNKAFYYGEPADDFFKGLWE
jgi:hypothetical protein